MGDVSSVARHHRRGAGGGRGDDRPIDDVGGASVGEDPTDAVCGVLVEVGHVTPTEQTTKLDLTR